MNYQNPEENEHLSVEDEKVRQMCGGLKRIDAPIDFDFRLKARIANHKAQSAKSPIFAFLRYAAPFGLAIVILGVIVSNSFYSVENTAVPQIAGNFTVKPPVEDSSPIENETFSELASRNNGPSANFEDTTVKSENSNSNLTLQFSTKDKNELAKILENPKNNRPNDNNGDSRDSASRQPRVISPQGFNNSNVSIKPNVVTNMKPYSVKDLLLFIGIKADFLGNGWKVQSVRQNSKAENSDIKPNDIIEAVNGIKLSSEMLQINLINGTKMTVVRDGKRFEIVLK